ncbi:hypothetical protein FPV67DRAFT_1763043, partial [Lyophyllum atratum]
MRADSEKVAENHQKEAKRQEKRDTRAAAITETGRQLVLDHTLIDTLNVLELNRQLDWHRDNEKNFPDLEEKVPLKTHMSKKADRVDELKKAVVRYQGLLTSGAGSSSEVLAGV